MSTLTSNCISSLLGYLKKNPLSTAMDGANSMTEPLQGAVTRIENSCFSGFLYVVPQPSA